VLFGRWLVNDVNWKREPHLQNNLQLTLQTLRRSVDDLVVVGPSPYWSPSLPDLVYRSWARSHELPDRLDLAMDTLHDGDIVMRQIADDARVRFASIVDVLCDRQGCLTHTPAARDDLLAFDFGHFTAAGATYLVQTLNLDLPNRAEQRPHAGSAQR
jgi:SGNH domain (fused to AT3 domains)